MLVGRGLIGCLPYAARGSPGRAVAAHLSPRTVRPGPDKDGLHQLWPHDQARAGDEFPSEGVADSGNPFTFVFDILALAGTDVRSKPYAGRRALLEDLLGRQLPHGLVLMPMTTDFEVARA